MELWPLRSGWATGSTTDVLMTSDVHRWRALLWKAARESRGRFWISLVFLLALVSYVVLTGPAFVAGYARIHPEESLTYSEYVWQALFNYYFQGCWIAAVLTVGFGGLLRERATGVAALTLGLPLSRRAVVASQVVVGVGEAVALAMIPVMAIPLLSRAVGIVYPLSQAMGFGFLLLSAGLVFFCYGVLLSAIFENELTAPILGFITVSAAFMAMKASTVHRFSIFDVMNGARSINPVTHFIERALPWPGIILSIAVAITLLLTAARILRRRDF